MDEMDPATKRLHCYAIENENSSFDKIISEDLVKLPKQPNKIQYQTKSGTTKLIFLKKKNKYHQIIFNACNSGFQSYWFAELNDLSKPAYFEIVRSFFDWINESGHDTTDASRYDILKVFEAYCLNDRGLKVSPLRTLNIAIRGGLACPKISDLDHDYLQTLLLLSKSTKSADSESITLSNWFNLPWLRSIIGEQAYLQLESPKLLFNSFRVTIATTLLYLLRQRQHWQQSSIIEFDSSCANWQYNWGLLLLKRDGKFNKKGYPEDEFSQFLLLDLVKPSAQNIVKNRLKKSGLQSLTGCINYKKKKFRPWQKPAFLHPAYQAEYSYLEQTLCAWLMACESIQPTDIPKLKTTNYARERNASGRLIAMECTYYKGRSGTSKQPAILMGSDPWTRAVDWYMTGLSSPSLFTTRVAVQDSLSISTSRNKSISKHNSVNLLFKIWRLPSFQNQLESELKRAQSTPLFLDAMLALEQGDESYPLFYYRTKKLVDEYRATISRPLPASLFTLSHIKNTAVHANTDTYREADLINHHSHTSLTERTSYLTDQNKEWVNQAGRITRLVLHDLQNVVFQPSITAISQSVCDLELRTQVSEATHTNDTVIYSIHSMPIERESNRIIVVSDTNDTALYFIHYISQAEALLPKLLAVRPDWVERELIVKVEWMTRMLTSMRTTANAKKTYQKLAAYLPPLFDHLLETTE